MGNVSTVPGDARSVWACNSCMADGDQVPGDDRAARQHTADTGHVVTVATTRTYQIRPVRTVTTISAL